MTTTHRNSWLLAAVPFALLLYVVVKFGVPVPFQDEWDLVPLLEKMYAGTLTLSDMWALHNEHRLLFPQMIMLGLARLTNWDLRYEMATSVLLAAGIFLFLAWQITITARKLARPELYWAIPLFSVIIFSIAQYQNWLWGWQLEIFLSVLGVVGGIVLLANPPFTWVRFFGAAIFGVIASYSFGNGGVFWLIGLLILFVVTEPTRERWIRLAVWLVLSGLAMVLYFYHYERLEEHPPLILLFSEPIQYLVYVFKYLGNIGAQYPVQDISTVGMFAFLFGLTGVALLIWAMWVLLRKDRVELRTLLPFIAFALYSVASAMVTGIGRLGLGTDQAVASRYCTISAPFWAALVVVLLLIRGKTKVKGKIKTKSKPHDTGHQTAARFMLGVVTILLLFGSVIAISGAVQMKRYQTIGRDRLLTIPITPTQGVDYSPLGTLHPRPQIIIDRFPFLKEHRLTVFRDEPPKSTGN